MPRTRRGVAADEKRDEIVAAAERQLSGGGAGAFSVAAVARELGVAQNTIYWYFPSKDHLFTAALRRILERTLGRKRAQELGLADEIVWFVAQLHELAPLRAALQDRARTSDVAASFARDFNELLRTMLTNALRGHVGAEDLAVTAEVFAATVDGSLLQWPDDPMRRRRVVAFALERLTGGKLRTSQGT